MSTLNRSAVPYGLCHCGCGQKTRLSIQTRSERGQFQGQPVKYMRGHNNRRPQPERFWEKVDKDGPVPEHAPALGRCWIWTAYLNANGYGTFERGLAAHRWSWELTNGPIPEGLQLDHLCRVRNCVNPAHLEPVTAAENTRRSSSAKLSAEAVLAIRRSSLRGTDLAKMYGVSRSTLSMARNGVRWQGL